MYKKLITACMALAAFVAFAVMPATASATNDPSVVEKGTAVSASHASPTAIVGTSEGNVLFKQTEEVGNGTHLTCTSATIKGNLETNAGGTVEGTITEAEFKGTGGTQKGDPPECTGISSSGITVSNLPWCLRSTVAMATDEFQVRGGGCTSPETDIAFTMNTTAFGACVYTSTGVIKGTFTTSNEESTLSVKPKSNESGFTKVSGSFFCPHSGALEMTFHIETTNGTKLGVN